MDYTKHNTTELGRYGEDVACKYLADKGFRIIARNFRYSHKEIDIIAENDTTRIFVEVKARTNRNNQLYHYGHRPCDAVNKQKQRLVESAVLHYLRLHPTNKGLRMDIIEVFFYPYWRFGKPVVERVHHIESAFGIRY